MAGTKAGGAKAAATNKSKYGKDFYSKIGQKGGKNGICTVKSGRTHGYLPEKVAMSDLFVILQDKNPTSP